MVKLLFLDIDGVLNTTSSLKLYSLKRSCLQQLERIVKETGCDIILSSTWRRDEYAMQRLERVLTYRGLKIRSTTPYLGRHRGLEISNWLWDHGYGPDNPAKIAILDDDSDMEEWQRSHFFQTDPDYGLTKTIAYRVVYHLNES